MALFITFEGGEGSGKSTQAKLLYNTLQTLQVPVFLTREPGGSPGAEEIRNLLVTGQKDRWTPIGEVLLIYAARINHWEKFISPHLQTGACVICDRFNDSTIAYQGFGHGVDLDFLEYLYTKTVNNAAPDITFICDIDAQSGLNRALYRINSQHNTERRFEDMDSSFHERVRKGFLAIAQNDEKRCHVLDGNLPITEIHQQIKDIVNKVRAFQKLL